MLSFLIEKCGAEASELPQLVKLNTLMHAEDPQLTKTAPSSSSADTAAAPAQDNDTNAVNPVPTSDGGTKDRSMLGFLLDRCATAEERVQCPVLLQMRGWLLHEGEEGPSLLPPPAPAPAAGAAEEKAKGAVALPPPPPASTAGVTEDVQQAAPPPAEPFPVFDIPIPIVPGAGDWRGSITVFASPPPLPPQPAVPSISPAPVTETAPTARPVRTAQEEAGETSKVGVQAEESAPAHPPSTVSQQEPRRQRRAEREGEAAHPSFLATPPPPTSLPSPPPPPVPSTAAVAPHSLQHSDAAPPPATPPHEAASGTSPQRPQRTVPSYAGRMPRPAFEALAVRNSATVRLLANAAVARTPGNASRPSSSIPTASRPMSGFARRFIADLYDRARSPSGHATSVAQLQPSAVPLATGSGVRAAREHHRQPQSSSEPWHAQGRSGLSGAAAFTPAPPAVPRPAAGSEPRRRRPSLPRPAAAVAVLPSLTPHTLGAPRRPLLRPDSAPWAQRRPEQSEVADSEGPLGLMVVGERIRLPSAPPTRPRHAQ